MLDISKLACQAAIRETPLRRDPEFHATSQRRPLGWQDHVGCRENADPDALGSTCDGRVAGPDDSLDIDGRG
jgi:hypothetical protein